jgi:hypothetical protein
LCQQMASSCACDTEPFVRPGHAKVQQSGLTISADRSLTFADK